MVERSPEKAGVGGSTPSLATIVSSTSEYSLQTTWVQLGAKTERRSSPFSAAETQRRDCVTCRVDDLRPHPSYVKHQLSVSTSKITALQRLGDRAFLEPIAVTQDWIIIDGYARWELAKLRNIATVLCLEYRLTEDEALCFMLRKQCTQQRSLSLKPLVSHTLRLSNRTNTAYGTFSM